jgi:hypothetical protein
MKAEQKEQEQIRDEEQKILKWVKVAIE